MISTPGRARRGLATFVVVAVLSIPASLLAQPGDDADDAPEDAPSAAARGPVAPARDAPLSEYVTVYAEVRQVGSGGERGVLALPGMDAIVQGAAQFLVARAEAEAELYGIDALHDLLCEDASVRVLVPTTCDALAGLSAGEGAPSGRLRLDALVAALRVDIEGLPPNLLRAVLAVAPPTASEGARMLLAIVIEILDAYRARIDAEEMIDRVFRAALSCDVKSEGTTDARDCATAGGKAAQRSLLRAAMLARWALGGSIEPDAALAFFRVEPNSPRAPEVKDAVARVVRTVRRLARAVREASGVAEGAADADGARARATAVGRQLVTLVFDAHRATRIADGMPLAPDRLVDQARLAVEDVLDPASLGPNEALAGAIRALRALVSFASPPTAAGTDGAAGLKAADDLLAALSVAAALAAAQDAAAVRAILEQLVAPVGSWRGKRAGWMVSITGLVGAAGSREALLGVDRESWAVGLHASIGLDVNLLGGSAGTLGFYVPLLDLGGVASVPFGLDAEDDQLETEPDLLSILSPGVYLRIGLFNSPIVLGGGASWVPRARQIEVATETGETRTRTRDAIRFSLLLAIDTTLWVL